MSTIAVSPVRIGKQSIAALGLLALALGTLQSVVEPALPLLQRELGVSPAEGALVSNALLITGAVVTPVAGKLGDRYGGRRVLVWLMAVVSAGGLLASLAPNLPVLLFGQVLQGVMVGALLRGSTAGRCLPVPSTPGRCCTTLPIRPTCGCWRARR
jgi:MFS family permease